MTIRPSLGSITVLVLSICASIQAVGNADPISITYNLEANGPESSTVVECPRLLPCSTYPIDGHIRVTLNPDQPLLENVDSNILVPPDAPAPFSPIIWDNLILLVGEYTSDTLSAEVSMRFTLPPLPAVPLPPYELFVHLTEGRSTLALTGGYIGVLVSPEMPNEVTFSVHGRAIPEPAGAALCLAGFLAFIASRRRR